MGGNGRHLIRDDDIVSSVWRHTAVLIDGIELTTLCEDIMTINFGSLLCMKVVGVNRDYDEDYTASLPLIIAA